MWSQGLVAIWRKRQGWQQSDILRLDSTDKLQAAYAKARKYLVRGRAEKAYTLVKEIFIWRGNLNNETHIRVKHFINPLLKSFCLAATSISGDFMNDILVFCLEDKRYDELEILLEECRYPIRETRADSSINMYPWNEYRNTIQSMLALLGAPRSGVCWEDSRMYCRTWDSLIMMRTFPDDLIPHQPIAVTVHPHHIEYHDAIQEQQFKGSEIVGLLERKRELNDWDILLAWENQLYSSPAKAFASTSGPHKIWVFPEDIIGPEISTLKGQQEDMYRFYHLNPDRSEWMTIRHSCKDFANDSYDNPNEPRDPKKGPCEQRYRHLGTYDLRFQEPFVQKEKYKIMETVGFNIEVTVPFVPWEHFENSAAYQAGLAYRDYMATIIDGLCGRNYFDNRAKLCRATSQEKRPDWRIPTDFGDKNSRAGFFDCIPSGNTLILRDWPFANIVSTRWHDWKHFSLHCVEGSVGPNIVLPSGEVVSCLGSINGSWKHEEDVDLEWHDIQAFVVDVDIKDESNETINFVLSDASVRLDKSNALTSPEMRFFSSKLSPYLFRYGLPRFGHMGSMWKKSHKVETGAVLDEDARQWEETNRRDKWDRTYEKRLRVYKKQPNDSGVADSLGADYEEEQVRRREWDKKYQKPQNLSSSSATASHR